MKKISENGNEKGTDLNEEKVSQGGIILDITEEIREHVKGIEKGDMSKEKMEEIDNVLSEEQKNTIGLDILSLPTMTISKITVIGYMLSPDDIKDIGLDKLAEIDIDELNELTKKYM